MSAQLFVFAAVDMSHWQKNVLELRQPEAASGAAFHSDLGSFDEFWRDWSCSAAQLDLKRLRSVEREEPYDWGLFCHGECLDGLEQELRLLEEHWRTVERDTPRNEELRRQLQAVRDAIRVAREIQGLLILILWSRA